MLPTAEQPISPLDESPLDENVNNLKLKASSANDKEDGSYNLKAVQQDGTIDDNDALRKLLDIDRIFRSVHSGPILPEHRSPSPNTRDDSSQVIGNPLHFIIPMTIRSPDMMRIDHRDNCLERTSIQKTNNNFPTALNLWMMKI